MQPRNMVQIVNGKRYRTDTATLLASDAFFDGHNWERKGRNWFLFRTPAGNYFLQLQTQWQGERDSIEVLTKEGAIGWYERLPEHEMEAEDAFPGVIVEDA